jgi:hypothetical protein
MRYQWWVHSLSYFCCLEDMEMARYLGQRFGDYRLVQLLSQGGFAEVYEAEHVHLGTKAAIKLLTGYHPCLRPTDRRCLAVCA